MKGLLTKDIRLILQRKGFFLMMFVIAIMLGWNDSSEFVVGYMVMISALFTISTISYDEYDNCYAYLMTMPIDSKTYVYEKYVLGTILDLVAWGVSCVIHIIMVQSRGGAFGPEDIVALILVAILAFPILALEIPVQLKFGGEKSRIVLFAVVGAILAIVLVAKNFGEKLNLQMPSFVDKVDQLGDAAGLIIVLAVVIVLSIVSVFISVRIMEKKEY